MLGLKKRKQSDEYRTLDQHTVVSDWEFFVSHLGKNTIFNWKHYLVYHLYNKNFTDYAVAHIICDFGIDHCRHFNKTG